MEPALEELGNGYQAVPIVGQRPALEARMDLAGDVVFQHLHQARFPNTGLARQHYHLAHALLDSAPSALPEFHFRRAAHQRRQAAGGGDLQTTCIPLVPSTVHLQGLRQAVERLLPLTPHT